MHDSKRENRACELGVGFWPTRGFLGRSWLDHWSLNLPGYILIPYPSGYKTEIYLAGSISEIYPTGYIFAVTPGDGSDELHGTHDQTTWPNTQRTAKEPKTDSRICRSVRWVVAKNRLKTRISDRISDDREPIQTAFCTRAGDGHKIKGRLSAVRGLVDVAPETKNPVP